MITVFINSNHLMNLYSLKQLSQSSPLPESELDRFLIRRAIGYPEPTVEAIVLRDDPASTELPQLRAVVSIEEVLGMQRVADQVKFDDSLVAYLLRLVTETREHEALELGVSPRGAIALRRAAQARAVTEGRDFCIPEDVNDLAVDVFAHRVSIDPRSRHPRGGEETQWIIRDILEQVPVPL